MYDDCTYNEGIQFKWSTFKAEINYKKHGVDFADAVTVLSDDYALTIEDGDHHEQRFVTLGMDAIGQLVVVVYAYPDDDTIRIISARKANRIEKRFYENK